MPIEIADFLWRNPNGNSYPVSDAGRAIEFTVRWAVDASWIGRNCRGAVTASCCNAVTESLRVGTVARFSRA